MADPGEVILTSQDPLHFLCLRAIHLQSLSAHIVDEVFDSINTDKSLNKDNHVSRLMVEV